MPSINAKPKILYLGAPKHTSTSIREQHAQHFDIDILDVSTRAELLDALPTVVATQGPYLGVVCRLGPQPFEPFDAQLLAPLLPHLRVVVSAQRGYDDFDIDWMTRRGIWFANTRHSTSMATADMAIFLILAVIRDASRAEMSFRSGQWRSSLPLARDMDSLTLGIIGMGCIGTFVAHKATALGMRVQYLTRSGVPSPNAPAGAVACQSFEQLLRTSDVLSLHCPLTPDTYHMIGKRELGMMKDKSYLINTSRGAIVDSKALIEALEDGKILRAGLDVFENEPYKIDPYFFGSDKVVVQPHLGGLTEGSFERAERECLTNLWNYVETSRPLAPVNNVNIEGPTSGVYSVL